jgi:uncharacterized cupredoxin-like copper-binding protein
MGDMWVKAPVVTAKAYELVCLMPGHYAAGQHLAFTVTP